MTRNTILRFCADIICIILAFVTAFLVRLDFAFDMNWFQRMLLHLPFVVVIEWLAMKQFGATRGAWRFVSIADVKRIILALLIAQIPFCIERVICGALVGDHPGLQYGILPWGVICINFCFAVLACIGARTLRRMKYETKLRQSNADTAVLEKAILIGSGTTAKQVLDSIRLNPQIGLEIVAVISDQAADEGRQIAGIPIYSDLQKLPDIAKTNQATQAIITQNEANPENLSAILDACAGSTIKTRVVPCMNDILSGAFNIGQLREICVEDLLHRDPIQLDKAEISKFLHGRRILVSGAGGSIGSEICRQVLAFEPSELVLLERCELFLYEIERELRDKCGNTKIVPRLADICDESRMNEIFEECTPEVIFHAAAYKHVPMLEYNPGEAIRNNVEGTMTIANCAVSHHSDAFVMISTDKAVNPTSVMGTSKRIAELYIQGMSNLGKTRFCAVRFGNVLGSTGSVLPLFKSQISSGGPITVTHPDMVRYFMTIPEASQLVMQAGTMGQNGEIFVLDMGKPVKIVDLARDLIKLSGKTEQDIPIVFSGTRPGEKLFEELGFDAEKMDRTGHPKIYVGKLKSVDLDAITAAIEKLKPFRDSQDNAAVRAAMHEIVPEMMKPAT
ncbi:MAG: polysaccharide biosynthesis protein [Proteobacteria bacterium]|nr:polysaccharide biosynthesis protein [Pseudomonadota bacterium]